MDRTTFETKLRQIGQVETSALYKDHLLSKLREEIYLFLLARQNEDAFYDFFHKKEYIENDLIKIICEELQNAQFKWRLGYGGTALFIFKETIPKTFWE